MSYRQQQQYVHIMYHPKSRLLCQKQKYKYLEWINMRLMEDNLRSSVDKLINSDCQIAGRGFSRLTFNVIESCRLTTEGEEEI